MGHPSLEKVRPATCGEPWIGMPLGLTDREGNALYVGDVLEFDEKEWGAPRFFVLDFVRGGYIGPYDSDISEWCTLRVPYTGRKIFSRGE